LVTLGAVSSYPIDASDGIGEKDFVGSEQMLGQNGAFVDFDAVGQSQIDHLHAHGARQATFFQTWGVKHAIANDEKITGGRLEYLAAVVGQEDIV
jgi:hypothetical protein